MGERMHLLTLPGHQATQMAQQRFWSNTQCPPWNGKDPGKTLRPWIQSQVHWLITTGRPVSVWGISLWEALEAGSVARAHADTIPSAVRYTAQGYRAIAE